MIAAFNQLELETLGIVNEFVLNLFRQRFATVSVLFLTCGSILRSNHDKMYPDYITCYFFHSFFHNIFEFCLGL